MKKFGLIGFPLTHSFSERYFREKFQLEAITDCVYENFPIENVAGLPELIRSQPELCGLNVTIPHKESVLQFLDHSDDLAVQIGAVNCIKIHEGKMIGFNTDALGFEMSIKPFLENKYERALILGSGGASKAIAFVLKRWGIPFHIVSREKHGTGLVRYEDLHEESMKHFKLIINTTPCGMYPDIHDLPPIPYDGIGRDHFLYDIIYNPTETRFLSMGKERGAQVMNGLKMLELQAEASWRIWNDIMS